MELLYSLTPLGGSEFSSIRKKRKCRSTSDPIDQSCESKNSNFFIRISNRYRSFEIILAPEMDCLRRTESSPTFAATLPKSFCRSRDRQSFLRRSFHSVRKNVVRQSERFMDKHFKAKPKRFRRSHDTNFSSKISNDFSTYNDRTLPNSALCDIVLGNDKSFLETTSKNRQSSRSSNSVQSPSTEITSTKRHLSPEPSNPVSTGIATNHSITTSNKNDIVPFDSDKHKRKSMSDIVIVRGNVTTYSSIKNGLSVEQNPLPTATTPNSNAMPSLTGNHSEANGSTGSTEITAAVSTATTTTNNAAHEVHLQPKSINVTTNLSSNSSLNSSSVKSTTSKSNDGASMDKKPKSTSRSRQKKFHRHFKQVALDEEVINFFSCAFVSDILLQGYLYITNNYLAFYSNVFGYVTKLLIPITSVTKISKEKTVKIIPNAIAVVTSDERHVFSNFLSRESAYRLMIRVWQDAIPTSGIDILTSSAQLRVCSFDLSPTNSDDTKPIFAKVSPKQTLQVVVHQRHRHSNAGNFDVSEMDDDSSSAISGNECLTQILSNATTNADERPDVSSSSSDCNNIINNETSNCDLISTNRESASDLDPLSICKVEADSATSSLIHTAEASLILEKPLDSSSTISFFTFKIPRTIHIAYFGLSLVIILTLMAIFLYWRIVEMKNARMQPLSADDLKSDSKPNLEHFAEILKWQKDMQVQRVHLTKNVLANNLEQISQISDSLQTLSNLIHANEENTDLDDEELSSTIMGECNSNSESCIMNQRSPLSTPNN